MQQPPDAAVQQPTAAAAGVQPAPVVLQSAPPPQLGQPPPLLAAPPPLPPLASLGSCASGAAPQAALLPPQTASHSVISETLLQLSGSLPSLAQVSAGSDTPSPALDFRVQHLLMHMQRQSLQQPAAGGAAAAGADEPAPVMHQQQQMLQPLYLSMQQVGSQCHHLAHQVMALQAQQQPQLLAPAPRRLAAPRRRRPTWPVRKHPP